MLSHSIMNSKLQPHDILDQDNEKKITREEIKKTKQKKTAKKKKNQQNKTPTTSGLKQSLPLILPGPFLVNEHPLAMSTHI